MIAVRLSSKRRNLLLSLYLLGLLAGLFMHSQRWAQESANHSIELVLDYKAMADLARSEGKPLASVLKDFQPPGVNASLAFSELRQDDLENRGLAEVYTGLQLNLMDIPMPSRPDMSKTYLVIFQPDQVQSLMSTLQVDLGKSKVRLWKPAGKASGKPGPDWGTVGILEIDNPSRDLGNLGFGFPLADIAAVQAQGFKIWLRPENKPQSDDASVKAILEPLSRLHPEGLIFGGSSNEVVGYPDALNTTADLFKANGWKLGLIESDKKSQQKGIEGLVRQIPEQTVRVFAIAPAHLATLHPERAAQMYSLGGRERNIRVIYLRPYPYVPNPEKDFQNANGKLMEGIFGDLKNWGPASEISRPVRPNYVCIFFMALGSWAVTWLMLDLLAPTPAVALYVLAAILVCFSVVTVSLGPIGQLWRSLMALGTGAAGSLFAMISQYRSIDDVSQRKSGWDVLRGSLVVWLRMSMLSLVAAWLASSYLQETTFKLGLDIFRGVKLLTVGVPIIAVLAWITRERGIQPIREFMAMQLKFYHLVAFLCLSVLGVIYTLRTGNMSADLGGEALEYERVVRVLLDEIFGVRPRFKEFLLAHPAMIVLPIVIWMGGRSVAWLILLAGALGQCGLEDTFAHIHTPLKISLIRSFLGLGLGALVGSALGALLIWWRERHARSKPPA